MISKFFALKLYISWGPRTPKKLEDLLQQGWRLYKSTVKKKLNFLGPGGSMRMGKKRTFKKVTKVKKKVLLNYSDVRAGVS